MRFGCNMLTLVYYCFEFGQMTYGRMTRDKRVPIKSWTSLIEFIKTWQFVQIPIYVWAIYSSICVIIPQSICSVVQSLSVLLEPVLSSYSIYLFLLVEFYLVVMLFRYLKIFATPLVFKHLFMYTPYVHNVNHHYEWWLFDEKPALPTAPLRWEVNLNSWVVWAA